MTQPNIQGESTQKRKKMSTTGKIFITVGAVVLVAAVAAAIYFFLQYMALKSNPDTVAAEKTDRITKQVGSIYTPPNETPTIAEISDKDKLKDQPFFANAENGDFLLIYPNAKQALIYRESTNKLVNVGPISITNDEKSSEAQDQKK